MPFGHSPNKNENNFQIKTLHRNDKLKFCELVIFFPLTLKLFKKWFEVYKIK